MRRWSWWCGAVGFTAFLLLTPEVCTHFLWFSRYSFWFRFTSGHSQKERVVVVIITVAFTLKRSHRRRSCSRRSSYPNSCSHIGILVWCSSKPGCLEGGKRKTFLDQTSYSISSVGSGTESPEDISDLWKKSRAAVRRKSRENFLSWVFSLTLTFCFLFLRECYINIQKKLKDTCDLTFCMYNFHWVWLLFCKNFYRLSIPKNRKKLVVVNTWLPYHVFITVYSPAGSSFSWKKFLWCVFCWYFAREVLMVCRFKKLSSLIFPFFIHAFLGASKHTHKPINVHIARMTKHSTVLLFNSFICWKLSWYSFYILYIHVALLFYPILFKWRGRRLLVVLVPVSFVLRVHSTKTVLRSLQWAILLPLSSHQELRHL